MTVSGREILKFMLKNYPTSMMLVEKVCGEKAFKKIIFRYKRKKFETYSEVLSVIYKILKQNEKFKEYESVIINHLETTWLELSKSKKK